MAASGGQVTLTKHPDGCLMLMPRPAWESFRARLQALPMEVDGWRRIFTGSAVDVDIDSASRLHVSPELRTDAGLVRDVLLMGTGARLELWDTVRYASYESRVKAQPMPDVDAGASPSDRHEPGAALAWQHRDGLAARGRSTPWSPPVRMAATWWTAPSAVAAHARALILSKPGACRPPDRASTSDPEADHRTPLSRTGCASSDPRFCDRAHQPLRRLCASRWAERVASGGLDGVLLDLACQLAPDRQPRSRGFSFRFDAPAGHAHGPDARRSARRTFWPSADERHDCCR